MTLTHGVRHDCYCLVRVTRVRGTHHPGRAGLPQSAHAHADYIALPVCARPDLAPLCVKTLCQDALVMRSFRGFGFGA
jgi:hypothetical protein